MYTLEPNELEKSLHSCKRMSYLTKKGIGRGLENLLLKYQKPKFGGKFHKVGDNNSTYYKNKCL